MTTRVPKSSKDFGSISSQEIDTAQKACAVALHPDGAPARVAAFHHPTQGAQLVKGTITPGEHPTKAAARELWEETGLTVRAGLDLGHSDTIQPGERWHFTLLRPSLPVPNQWQHQTVDDHGHLFSCFWQPLDAEHPFQDRHARAWDFIKAALA